MARPDEDGIIVCTGCERPLPGDSEHFHRHRDAFKPRCKECRGSSFGIHHVNKVIDVGEGRRVCASCHRVLPADTEHFHRSQKTDGFVSRCKECRGVEYGIHRPNRVETISEGLWKCKPCGRVLPRNGDNFYRGALDDGYDVYCKECYTFRQNTTRRVKEGREAILNIKEWFEVQEKWSEDGETTCAYCGRVGEVTQDHAHPLSKGGKTVAENIVPACLSCNSRKSDKEVFDWFQGQCFFDEDRWEKICKHRGNR